MQDDDVPRGISTGRHYCVHCLLDTFECLYMKLAEEDSHFTSRPVANTPVTASDCRS